MKGSEIFNRYPDHGIKLVGRQRSYQGFLDEDLIDNKWFDKDYQVSIEAAPPNISGSLRNWFSIEKFIDAINDLANREAESKDGLDLNTAENNIYKMPTTFYYDSFTKDAVVKLIGSSPDGDAPFIKRMRFHQGWWRTAVLALIEGQHPKNSNDKISSCILEGEKSLLNFLDEDAIRAVRDTLDGRDPTKSKGLVEPVRLFNNLLGSQPLCFNFFGKLKYNLELAKSVLIKFYPTISKVTSLNFEFVPQYSSNSDNSAHDIAIEFIDDKERKCLIGLECKYTEPFSTVIYDKPRYKEIHTDCKAFTSSYEDFMTTDYNQLFRNQLIAESAKLCGEYQLVYTGLFYFQVDVNADRIGRKFQTMIVDGTNKFALIPYCSFLEQIQKNDIDWETREWSMQLWARYCATKLSDRLYK